MKYKDFSYNIFGYFVEFKKYSEQKHEILSNYYTLSINKSYIYIAITLILLKYFEKFWTINGRLKQLSYINFVLVYLKYNFEFVALLRLENLKINFL